MIPIDGSVMFEIAPRFSGTKAARQAEIIGEVGPILQETLARYGIDTRLRVAHFLAQLCHESAGFRTTEEFADGSAYEGRQDLGNVHAGDGPRYKGRGLIQLTGRANYRTFSETFGRNADGRLTVDLEANPLRAAEPRLSLVIACEYWKTRKLSQHADNDDVVKITRRINGGLNGLEDRRNLLAKAKAALARVEGLQVSGRAPEDARGVLRRGSRGDAVAALQGNLRKFGFPLAVDGDFGAATELAIMRLQLDHDMPADGIVGPSTWDAIEGALARLAA